LLPGLTVSCKIIIDEIPDVIYVPVESVFNEVGTNYVFLKKGSTYKKTEVVTGQSNTDYIIVEKGLNEGDQVTLINPIKEEEKKQEKTKL